MWEICFKLVYRAIECTSDDMQKLMHTYFIPYLWLLKKIYNMHYTSHVKLFRIIKEENDLMKSSFEGRREHFVNLQIKNGETSNYKHGLFCTQTCFCSVSSLTTVTGILIIRLWMHLSKTFFSQYQQLSDRMSICWLESSGWLSGCDQDFEPDQKDLWLQFSVLVPSRIWITHQENHSLPKRLLWTQNCIQKRTQSSTRTYYHDRDSNFEEACVARSGHT